MSQNSCRKLATEHPRKNEAQCGEYLDVVVVGLMQLVSHVHISVHWLGVAQSEELVRYLRHSARCTARQHRTWRVREGGRVVEGGAKGMRGKRGEGRECEGREEGEGNAREERGRLRRRGSWQLMERSHYIKWESESACLWDGLAESIAA